MNEGTSSRDIITFPQLKSLDLTAKKIAETQKILQEKGEAYTN